MTNPGHSEEGRVTKPLSRRQEKKAARKLERAQSSRVRANTDAAIRNSRARRVHQILSRPGRGGLTAKGAKQLKLCFLEKVPEAEKPRLREMDESASMTVLSMASEEIDAEGPSCEELRQVNEGKFMENGEGHWKVKGDKKDRIADEDLNMEEVVEPEEGIGSEEEEEVGDEDWEQAGVALATEL